MSMIAVYEFSVLNSFRISCFEFPIPFSRPVLSEVEWKPAPDLNRGRDSEGFVIRILNLFRVSDLVFWVSWSFSPGKVVSRVVSYKQPCLNFHPHAGVVSKIGVKKTTGTCTRPGQNKFLKEYRNKNLLVSDSDGKVSNCVAMQ
jgi:hypothetical protein